MHVHTHIIFRRPYITVCSSVVARPWGGGGGGHEQGTVRGPEINGIFGFILVGDPRGPMTLSSRLLRPSVCLYKIYHECDC